MLPVALMIFDFYENPVRWVKKGRCGTVADRRKPPKNAYVLIVRTFECITLHGERDFVGVIQ